MIRLNIPALTAERRKGAGEAGQATWPRKRASRCATSAGTSSADLKELKKEGDISEDEERRAEEDVQKLTDGHIEKIDEVVHAQGKKEILEI